MRSIFCILLIVLISGCKVFFFGDSWSLGRTNYLMQAEEYAAKDEYQKAIDSYQKHIEQRLADPDKADWENPYFYLILIGDLHLKLGDPDAALAKYLEAQKQHVENEFISDRIRALAGWYENKGELQKAIDLLSANRDRDQFLFDSMLNRLTRKLTELERAK